MKKAIYSNGVTTYVDMTPQEIAEMLASQPVQEWHDNNCEERIFMTDEQYVDMLASEAGLPILQAFVTANLTVAKADGGRYIYYNFLHQDDENILRAFGADFQPKNPA